METITICPKGVLYASMGLQSTGIDYFVDGGQWHEELNFGILQKSKKR